MNHNRFLRAVTPVAGLLLAIMLPSLASGPTPSAPALSTILTRHLRAIAVTPGAMRDRSAVKTVYAIHAGPLVGTLSEWEAPPHRSRVEMALGPISQTEGDDGKTAWQQDSTGNVRIIRGPELAASRAAMSFSLESYDPLKSRGQGTVTLRPRREPGTGDYILDVAPKNGSPQILYLDPKTYLVHKMVAVKGGIAGTITILSYQTVSGQRVPAHLEISYAGLPLIIDAALTQAKRLAQVDPTLFALPTSAADCKFLTPGATSATVPFDDAHNEIIVAVVVNGKTQHFLLDSGSGGSFITAPAAKALGLQSPDTLFAFGYGGATATGLAAHATLSLPGGVEIRNQNLYVIKDPHVAELMAARGVDGGLGYDLLARLTVTIDYAQKSLTLTRPDAFIPPMTRVSSLPLSLETHVPTVLAQIDGKTAGKFLVDTGDSGAVHLYTQYARTNGLMGDPKDPNAQMQMAAGIGGTVSEIITPGHTLALGGTILTGIPVATSSDAGISSVSLGAGGIGNEALRHFIVTFDYAHARILLQKPAALPATGPLPTSYSPARFSLVAETDKPTADAGLQTTAAVLARHLKALGGRAAVAAIKTTRVDLTLETGGLKGKGTTIYKAPDKELETEKLGINQTSEGYDGKSAWQRDTNGSVRMLGEDERRDLRRELFIDTNAYVIPMAGLPGQVVLHPQREPGTGDYILDLLPKDGKPSVIYLDPKTFLISKEQHNDDDILETTTFADYRSVDGVQFPFTQRTTNGTPRYDIVLHVTDVKNNIPVSDSLFIPPSAMGSKTRFLTPGATTASTPFTFDDGEITVPVVINGKSSRVYLDSGASGLALSQAIADTLHLKGQGVLEARGYGGSTDLHPVKVDTFEIPGAIRLSDLVAVAIALPPGLDQTPTGPLAGFIGYDLLSQFVVRVDYANRKITLTDPSAFTPTPADGTPLPLNLDNDLPSITAQFGGLPPAQFLLDTGDVSVLRLYGPYVEENKLRTKYPKQISAIGGGIGGESRSMVVKADSFTVAGETLRGLPTDLSLDTKGGASQLLAGSLGSGLLSRFVVTFDYPHSRVFFAPNQAAAAPFDTRSYGLTAAQINDQLGQPHIVVVEVTAGSPAAQAGVVQYDQILEIDGQSVKTLTITQIRALLSPAPGVTAHTLTLSSPKGEQRTLTVSLYDPLS